MANTRNVPHAVKSTISYLARDLLWSHEKPYIADFTVPEGEALSNQIIEKHPVPIYNLRDSGFTPTLTENGFCLMRIDSELSVAQTLEDPRSVEEAYLRELIPSLQIAFPEHTYFECIDLTVRKREADFPWHGETILIKHEQPAAVAHTDYSFQGALMELSSVFPGWEKVFEQRSSDVLK